MGIVLAIILSYFIGAIPSSIWVGKLIRGVDIRNHGSGNAGTTNTFRILGWRIGVIVGIFDLIKGYTATFFVSRIIFEFGSTIPPFFNWDPLMIAMIITGLIAVLGHIFPVYANFKGGKGVLTAAGVLLAIEPISVLLVVVVFVSVLFPSRYVSLASITAVFSYPIILLILKYWGNLTIDGSVIVFAIILAISIILKHKTNIRRLLDGSENSINSFKPAKGWLNKEKSPT